MAIMSEKEFNNAMWLLGDHGKKVVSGVADNLERAFQPDQQRPDMSQSHRQPYGANPVRPNYQPTDQWHAGIGTTWDDEVKFNQSHADQRTLQQGPIYSVDEWPGIQDEWRQAKEQVTRPLHVKPADPRRDPELAGEYRDAQQYMQDERILNSLSTPKSVSTSPVVETTPPVAQATPQPTTWEAAFAAEHGRAPGSYDAMVRQEMDNWIKSGYASANPTRGDWERLATSLNRQGKGGPRDVPDYALGFVRGEPKPVAQPPQSTKLGTVRFDAEGLNRYLADQNLTDLQGKGQRIAEIAQANGVDPSAMAGYVALIRGQGDTTNWTDSELGELAARLAATDVKSDSQLARIQRGIRENYGTPGQQSTQDATGFAKPQGGGTMASTGADLRQFTDQPNGIGQPASISERGIDAYLAKEYPSSPLRRSARAIAAAGATYNIDPTTVLAILERESALMTAKGVGSQGNNPGSLAYGTRDDAIWLGADPDRYVTGSDGGKFLVFSTPEKGVEALAKLLGQGRYAREGRRTWGSLNDVFSSTARGDSPTWGEQVGQTAANIRRYYGTANGG